MISKCLFTIAFVLIFFSCTTENNQNNQSYNYPPTVNLTEKAVVSNSDNLTLARPAYVLPLLNSQFIIADTQTFNFHLIGDDFSHKHAFGRSGDGPGEFRRISDISISNSSIKVYDGRRSLISELTIRDDQLSLADTKNFTYTAHPDHPAAMFWRFIEKDDGENIALYYDYNISSQEQLIYHKIAAFPYNANYEPASEDPAVVLKYSPELKNENVVLSVPYLERGLIASINGNIVYALTHDPAVLIYDRSGKLIQTIDLPDTSSELTSTQKTEAYNRMYANSPDPDRFRSEVMSHIPDQRPIVRSLQSDAGQRIWVRIYHDETQPDWLVYDSDGKALFQTTLPEGHIFRNALDNLVYTQRNTEDGPEIVVLELES